MVDLVSILERELFRSRFGFLVALSVNTCRVSTFKAPVGSHMCLLSDVEAPNADFGT